MTPLSAPELWTQLNAHIDQVLALVKKDSSAPLKAENGLLPGSNSLVLYLFDRNEPDNVLLEYEATLEPALFQALWARHNPTSYQKQDGVELAYIGDTELTEAVRVAAGLPLLNIISPTGLRATSGSDSSEMKVSLMLAPEAMAKKDAFNRQFIALRKAQPHAPLNKHTTLIPPYRVNFSVWNTKTKKCVLEAQADVFPPLFEALWAKRDSEKYLVENGVQYCPINESHVATIFQAAVQAAA
jgi:hypothetical protein